MSKLAEEKALSEQKYGLKDLQNNPWKLSTPSSIQTCGLRASPSATAPSRTSLPTRNAALPTLITSARSTAKLEHTGPVYTMKPRRQLNQVQLAMDTTDVRRTDDNRLWGEGAALLNYIPADISG